MQRKKIYFYYRWVDEIDNDFLQNYLNEFCYKFNRRYFGNQTLERLIIAGGQSSMG